MKIDRARILDLFKKRSFWLFYFLPLVATLLLLVFFCWPRFEALRLEQELLAQTQKNITAYQARLKKLKKELSQPDPALQKAAQKVFTGKDPYEVVAALQKKFENIPEVLLRSFKVIKRQKEREGLEKVRISFLLYTDTKGLAEILALLEEEPHALRIRMLNLRYIKERQGERLNVNLEIEVLFWQKETA